MDFIGKESVRVPREIAKKFYLLPMLENIIGRLKTANCKPEIIKRAEEEFGEITNEIKSWLDALKQKNMI